MSWVRLYVEILDDPKTAMLPDGQFRLFCESLCLAKYADMGGDTGLTVEQLDWRLRRKTAKSVKALCDVGILILTEDKTVAVTQWAKRQFESDSSTDRVKKHRQKHREAVPETADETLHVTFQEQPKPVAETAPETESDTDSEQSQKKETDSAATPPVRRVDDVKLVFDHWREVMGHPLAKLGDNGSKRYRAVAGRLKDGYSVDDLRKAVEGCKRTPWNMGENDRGGIFDDLELICRDAAHVDRFLSVALNGHAPARMRGPQSRLTTPAAGTHYGSL